MHLGAYNFISQSVPIFPPPRRVLDIGSYDVNGSPRDLFRTIGSFSSEVLYVGIDVRPGPSVDLVVDAKEYTPERPFDLVIVAEVLEHHPRPQEILACAFRSLKDGGWVIITTAGEGRAPHSGIDGGELRPDETYANIKEEGLAAALSTAGFDRVFVETSREQPPQDVYALARRPFLSYDYLKRESRRLNYIQREVIPETRWRGIWTQKFPCDLWLYQEIIEETKPEVIVELGCHHGGSTQFLAEMLRHGEVIAVDLSFQDFKADHPIIWRIDGDLSDPNIFFSVQDRTLGRRTMVIHDADHRGEAVYLAMVAYAPLVSPGCYFIVEDGIVDVSLGAPLSYEKEPGPLYAIQLFQEGHPGMFEVGESNYALTWNPSGYLRRKEEP